MQSPKANKQQQINLKISDNTVVPYPAKELDDLKTVLEMDGTLKAIYENTGVTPPTVKGMAINGRGQQSKVIAVREFVKAFNEKFAA